MAVLDDFGLDHFPFFVELSYEPEGTSEQEAPHLDEAPRQEAQEAEEKLQQVGKER